MTGAFLYRAEQRPLFYTYTSSPIGELLLAGTEQRLHVLGFPEGKMALKAPAHWQRKDAPFHAVATQLHEYFAGARREFTVDLAPEGTAFQLLVWRALQQIPYGDTRSYGEIARAIGSPKAMRAVGAANGRNPLPIIVPCHRVIGSAGSMIGFGGGISTKVTLLALEKRHGDVIA